MIWSATVPLDATATNNPPPKVRARQLFATVSERVVQLIPSDETITRFVPLPAVATKKPLP